MRAANVPLTGAIRDSTDTCNLEAHFLKKSPDFCGLVSLHFDGALPDRAPGSESMAEVAREFFKGVQCEIRGEIVDDDDRPAAPVGGFASQDDPAQPFGLCWLDGSRRGRRRGMGAETQAAEGIAQAGKAALRGIDFDALWLFWAHGGEVS